MHTPRWPVGYRSWLMWRLGLLVVSRWLVPSMSGLGLSERYPYSDFHRMVPCAVLVHRAQRRLRRR